MKHTPDEYEQWALNEMEYAKSAPAVEGGFTNYHLARAAIYAGLAKAAAVTWTVPAVAGVLEEISGAIMRR